jgi:hypothetical protein
VKGLPSHFVWLNRSKESFALVLKKDAAKEVLLRLIARSDALVLNLAPGAAARLGFGAKEFREKHPRLIHCTISGYGDAGPYTKKKAYDLLVQCEAGLVSITSTEDTPSKVGISIVDIAAGMYGYSGILSALLRREKTGEGATMEVSMLEALGEGMGFPAYLTVTVAQSRRGAELRMPVRSIGTMDKWDEVYPGHRFHYAMHRIVVAARAAGLRAVDGPIADYRDEESLRRSCLIARSLGFDGKWCIHPTQIEIVNEVFSPTEREIEWAKRSLTPTRRRTLPGAGWSAWKGKWWMRLP